MTVPVLLVTGFLGAGKTTAINALLHAGHGERIAAIVNDFGAINIDAEILEGAADRVIGLQNGCICCSLQGDLLRTLRLVLAYRPAPERIVIEASGAADPRGIIEMVMDPVLWGAVSLDAVTCVLDAEDLITQPGRMDDPLWLAQLRNSDFALLGKTKGLEPDAVARLREGLARERKPMIDIDAEGVPDELLLGAGEPDRIHAFPAAAGTKADRFVTLDWKADRPVSLAAFQAALGQIAPGLLRAKGYLELQERPGRTYLYQLVGKRATFSEAARKPNEKCCRLILIGERESFDREAALHLLGLATES